MENERPYSYLDEFMTDAYADATGEAPVVFDRSRIRELEIIREVTEWRSTERARLSADRGFPVRKYFVRCPKHREYDIILPEPMTENSWMCHHCVTEEIDRIIALRARRDRDRQRRRRA